MDGTFTQIHARSKAKERGPTRVTYPGPRAKPKRMPPRSDEANKAYDADKIRAAVVAVMREAGLNPTSWARKAGISQGSLLSFLKMEDPSRPGRNVRPTEAPLVSMFFRLAWAAGVPVSRLLCDEGVQPAVKPSLGPPQEPAALHLAKLLTQVQEQNFEQAQRIYELERRLAEVERNRSRQGSS
jgi:hypothetical protein